LLVKAWFPSVLESKTRVRCDATAPEFMLDV
jgi:hypothetical protein